MGKIWKNYREESKEEIGDFHADDSEIRPSNDQIKLGAFLRIADSMEIMTRRHQELIEQRETGEKIFQSRLNEIIILKRRIAGLRGYIKRLKERT